MMDKNMEPCSCWTEVRVDHRFGWPGLIAACLSLQLASACVGISSAELLDLGSVVTETKVDFAELYTFAGRSKVAYASEAEIHSKYPATTRISAPGQSDVQYFLEQDDKNRTQNITIRGTADKKNFSEDLSIGIRDDRQIDIPVHAGFDAIAEVLYIDVKPHLKPGYRTYLTGHSLGGAIAALLAIYIIEDGHSVERVVTFGQPRFTTAAGVERLGSLPITRVVDENDMVPMLPPATSRHPTYGPYEHVGLEIILLEGPRYVFLPSHDANRIAIGEFWRSMSFASLDDHKMDNYLKSLAAKRQGAMQVAYNEREKYDDDPDTAAPN